MNLRCLLVLLALCFWLTPAHATTPAQYDAALAQVQGALTAQAATLRAGKPAATAPAVVARRALWFSSLTRPGGMVQPVNNALLLQSLDAAGRLHDPRRRASADDSLAGQIGALRAELTAPAPAEAGMRPVQTARAILSGPAFSADPLPPPSLWDRFTAWLDKWIADHTPHRKAGPEPNINPNFIKGLVVVLGIAAFAALVYVLMQMLGRRVARAQPLALDETEAALVDARDTDSLRALAEQQAAQGEFRRAFRLLYLAMLVALDTAQVLRFDRSKTNWEYLRALRAAGQSAVYAQMTPLTRDFDRIWYGFAPADAADYARARAQFDAVRLDALRAAPRLDTPVKVGA